MIGWGDTSHKNRHRKQLSKKEKGDRVGYDGYLLVRTDISDF